MLNSSDFQEINIILIIRIKLVLDIFQLKHHFNTLLRNHYTLKAEDMFRISF